MITVVILVGGLATRLYPITKDIPKSLVRVGGKAFISWQLQWLSSVGVKRVVLCTHHMSEMIENYIRSHDNFGIEVLFVNDGHQSLGTGGAIKNASHLLDETFAVMYGDSYLDLDLEMVHQTFLETRASAMMTVFRNDGKFDTSNLEFREGKVLNYSKERPSPEFTYIDYGLSFFNKQAFESYSLGEKFDLSEVFANLSSLGILAGFEVFRRFYEVGSYSGLKDFLEHTERMGHDL